MSQIAKIFMNGSSQAVRLPAAFRFQTSEVFIRRDPQSGDVVLSTKPDSWDGFLDALARAEVPKDFLDENERKQQSVRDPLDGWQE